MTGSEDERRGERRHTVKDGFKSLFTKSKNTSTKTGEQSSLPRGRGKLSAIETMKIDGAEAPSAQPTRSSVAQSTSLTSVNDPAMELLAASLVITSKTAPSTTPSNGSDPAQPATNKKDLPLPGAVDKVTAAPPIVSSQPAQLPKLICDLWNEAYEELKDNENGLIKDYEAVISKDMTTILGSTSLAIAAPEVRVMRKEQMTALIEKKVAEAKKNAWKLRYGDSEVLLKDLAGPVVDIINDAEKFVDGAVSANPYASIAWAGVSLLLPVSLEIQSNYPLLLSMYLHLTQLCGDYQCAKFEYADDSQQTNHRELRENCS
jgi:hypothetical protein